MLSLSQSQSQHGFAGQYSSYGNVGNGRTATVNGDGNRHNSGLPLTPPGSPEEEKNLVIASPAKTPCQPTVNFQRAYDAGQQSSNQTNVANVASAMNAGSADSSVGISDFSCAPASHYYGLMAPFLNGECLEVNPNSLLNSAIMGGHSQTLMKRTRMEKRPIPSTMKDEKYFERRRRNNLAAKRSRDTRKQREDDIALKAAALERENAILRAELLTLKEERQTLQNLVIQKEHRRQIIRMQQAQAASALG